MGVLRWNFIKRIINCLILFTIICSNTLSAQTDSSASYVLKDTIRAAKYASDTADQRDVIDVLVKLFKPKHFNRSNLKPGQVSFFILPAPYYTQATGFALTLNGTLDFLASDYKYQNLSLITASAGYTQKGQTTFSIYPTLWTKNNSFTLQGIWWYYDYSEQTFGLGSNTANSKQDLLHYKFLRLYETVAKQIFMDGFIGLGYKLDVHNNIREDGNIDGSGSDFNAYGPAGKTVSSGPSLSFLFDDRRNQINPRRGSYIDIDYSTKLTSLGSDQNWQYLKVDLRKYFKVSSSSNNVLAFWNLYEFTFGQVPYLDLPAVGWDDYQKSSRGYTQGRFRGKNMIYLEGEYRFKVTHNGVLGGVIFANAESFSEPATNNFQTILPAAGAGIRIKVNKYTRTNLSIDYGVGIKGSSGIFVNLGEVF